MIYSEMGFNPQKEKGRFLYWQRWTGPGPRIPLVIVHGAGEHSGRYVETGQRLAREGYAVSAFDLPGHGRSPGKRGHIRCFADYLEPLREFIGDQKPILIGHSLGGLVATFYAVEHPETLRCLVLSSPLWGLNVPVPAWKRAVARILSPLWPSLTMKRTRLTGASLSHDPQVEVRYLSDPLVHFQASVRLYTEIQDRCRELPRALPRLKVPLLLMQAGEDRVVSPEQVKRLFPLAGSAQKRLILYEGFYHELFNEVEKERVFRDLLSFLRDRATLGQIKGGAMAFQDGGYQGGGQREMHKVICSDCKKECEVPFKPSGDRPVYCKDCFSKRKGAPR